MQKPASTAKDAKGAKEKQKQTGKCFTTFKVFCFSVAPAASFAGDAGFCFSPNAERGLKAIIPILGIQD